PAAGECWRQLVAARLLTLFEAEPGAPSRVEIAHESLLVAWPRLVRWRTEDAAGVQLRDQLRRAPRTWRERGRPDDLLWTGAARREVELWRERYPGRLSPIEE